MLKVITVIACAWLPAAVLCNRHINSTTNDWKIPVDADRTMISKWIIKTVYLKEKGNDRIAQYLCKACEDETVDLISRTFYNSAAHHDGVSFTGNSGVDGLGQHDVVLNDEICGSDVRTETALVDDCWHDGHSFTRFGKTNPQHRRGNVKVQSNLDDETGESCVGFSGKSVCFHETPRRHGSKEGPWGAAIRRQETGKDGETTAGQSAEQNNPSNYQKGVEYLQHSQPVSEFVRRIFQDSRGDLWFGTNGDGVCRFNGKALEYFSTNEGFGGVAVRKILEDPEGNVWFGTENGLTRYDGKSFINYTEKEGMIGSDVWSMAFDNLGTLWIGTTRGVCRYDGDRFTPFELPESEPDPDRWATSRKAVHSIMQDSKGRMWFGTNGGAWIHDGQTLANLSESNGLCDNSVNDILEDKQGNIWFATHYNGICRWDGERFTHMGTDDGVQGTEAWSLYEDRSGNIWFPIENSGLYRYDGKTLIRYHSEQGLVSHAVQTVFEDDQGRIWCGGWLGLFRKDGESFTGITRVGPWK